jgi:hypothetical protein
MNTAAEIPGLTAEMARDALWGAGILRWKLWPQQEKIYDTIRQLPRTSQTVVVLCARQFGKSVLGTVLAAEDCQQNPNVVVLIIAPTVQQAEAIVRPRMKLLMRDAPPGLIREVKSENTWYFANGSELKLGGYSSNSVSQRGKTLYKVYLEEFGVDADPAAYLDFIRSDLAPAMTHSKHAQIIYMTTPPKIPDHPFIYETIPEAERAGAFFKFTIHDNEQLSPEQYAQCVKLCGGVDSIDFRREYLCEVVRDSSIVLVPEYDDAAHTEELPFDELPEYFHAWVSGDTGGVRDRTVFHLMAYDFEKARTLVLDEREFPPETASADYVAAAKVMELTLPKARKVRARWVDAPGQLQIDFCCDPLKYPCALPRKDELEPTVNQVRLAFTQGQVVIAKRCALTRATLRSGTFNERRTDLGRTATLGHMDAFMSLAYGLRHADKSNPFPPLYGMSHETHHVSDSAGAPKTKQGIASAFRPKLRR